MKPPRIRLCLTLLLVTFGAPCVIFAAQAPAAQTPPLPSAPQSIATASSIVNPAISTLQAALDGIRVEKWKASSSVRGQAEDNIASVRHDLETTLPPLLTAADAAPGLVTQIVPAYRNIEALYDVLLRISSVSRLAAPAQQSDALEQAISNLEVARRNLGDQMQTDAVNQDHMLRNLQAAAHPAPPPAPSPAPCPTPSSTTRKRKPHAKASPKPAETPAQPH